jgi:hypothetical protein
MMMTSGEATSLAFLFSDHCCGFGSSPVAAESFFSEIVAVRFVSFDEDNF